MAKIATTKIDIILSQATPRPWSAVPVFGSAVIKGSGGQSISGFLGPADADLIVTAVNNFEDLRFYLVKTLKWAEMADHSGYCDNEKDSTWECSCGFDDLMEEVDATLKASGA